MNFRPYKKLIVALIGAVLIAVDQFFGFSVGFNAEQVFNTVVPFLTAFGVYQVDNA